MFTWFCFLFAHRMDTNFFDVVAGVLQGDTLALYLFITFLDYVYWTSIDVTKGKKQTIFRRNYNGRRLYW